MNACFRRAFRVSRWLVIVLSFLLPAARAKSMRKDVVVMTNGDRLTGEVKSLQNGVLYVKTEYVSENIGVDWAQVQQVESSAMYQITLVNGVHMTGKIKRIPPDKSGSEVFLIESPAGNTRVPASNVAEILTQKETFWRQLKGSIDAGYSFTSGNGQTTLNSDANANYSTPNWITEAGISTSFSGQSGASRTNRIDGTLTVARFLSHNSYLGLLNEYLHSSEQDLSLRSTLGGGYGRYWIRTNNTSFRWIAGAVYTWESFDTVSGQPNDSNVESFFGAAYDAYRFKFGEIHLQANVFPGLSDFGRVRATTNNSLRIKLTNNFFFTMGFWDNYDSRPPTTAKKNELGVSSSIGWSF
jgi:putative salt-induced outer membrane protein YdiY/sRNA-binding regulator protein Hfq